MPDYPQSHQQKSKSSRSRVVGGVFYRSLVREFVVTGAFVFSILLGIVVLTQLIRLLGDSVSGLLAVALRHQGLRVGILDADITGPSIPKMFFPDGAQLSTSPVGPLPPESKGGIKVVSINLLLEQEDQAVIWRGPLVSGAIKQFWGDIFWGTLDYLIVDLPPGTSDASLTVMQALPLSGVVLVTSPQDLASMVVRKAARMAGMMQTPILGLIENMSYFECPDTGKRYEIFGSSHAEEMAAWIGVPLLGRLPIDPQIARLADAGCIEEYAAEPFAPIAQALIGRVPEAHRKG